MITISLVGNPNVGKSTVFNALCNARQHVGNYPGVTVEKKIGFANLDGLMLRVIDLPGLYSLRAASLDEQIAVDQLLGRIDGQDPPDLVVFVLDATAIERNLFLYSQVIELGLPVVVVLTMEDRLKIEGIELDYSHVKESLKSDFISLAAAKRGKNKHLKESLKEMIEVKSYQAVGTQVNYPLEITEAVAEVRDELRRYTDLSTFEARELLFHDQLAPAYRLEEHADAQEKLEAIRSKIPKWTYGLKSIISYLRYEWAEKVRKKIEVSRNRPISISDRIDSVVTNRVFGSIFFVALVFFIFQSVYSWAEAPMNLIDMGFSWLGGLVEENLESLPYLESLLVDGIIPGVGGVVVFLPQIIILFVFIALLEDSGYMARAAFIMDKMLGWSGLNGRSFVPLISGFACAIPAIMSTRVIADSRARIATILIIPLVSCSARLPVYALLVGAFIEPAYGGWWAAAALVLMHIIGLVIALPLTWLFNDSLLKSAPLPFLLELPSYRVPSLRNVWLRTSNSAKNFMRKAGTIIFVLSIVIWFLSNFPENKELLTPINEQSELMQKTIQADFHYSAADQKLYLSEVANEAADAIKGIQLELSYLGTLGKFIEPVFEPLGYDWKISVGVLGAFPAREVLVSTLGIIYNVSGDVEENEEESMALRDRLKAEKNRNGSPIYSLPVVLSLMVFIALSCQCMSTLAVLYRELNSVWWPIVSFSFMTGLAYAFSYTTYHIGNLLMG